MVKRGSPLQLTEHGQRVLLESGFQALLDDNESDVVEYLASCVTDTKYDVQECAERACESLFDVYCLPNHVAYNGLPEEFILQNSKTALYRPKILEIKNWLYDNGYRIHHLVDAGTIYARDKAIPVIFPEQEIA